MCMPKRKIGFLKTVKCASTSVQNILLRFALKHNLSIVLPGKEKGNHDTLNVKYTINDWFEDQAEPQFGRHLIENTSWERANITYHMFLLHTRWNHLEISNIMNRRGKENVFCFSILRDPVMLYRSFWDYYRLSQKYEKTLEEYAKTVISHYVLYNNMTWRPPGYNQMLHDFGMNFHDMILRHTDYNGTKMIKNRVTKKLQEIEESFDLILLADEEHFEDGMVLLKHELCWDFEDIINVKRNVQTRVPRSNISKEARKIIKGNKFHATQRIN